MKENNLKEYNGQDTAPVFMSAVTYKSLKIIVTVSLIAALFVSLFAVHISTQRNLRRTTVSVTENFSAIMSSYQHSFCLFEKILQQEIKNAENTDEIEAFLKEQDSQLLNIEGGDYDGVYMYYQGKYLYSWDTPRSAYDDTGYDATKRPWYLGAVEANGDIFFSTPYPSYANNYMLATISRLQDDGETVIAYDIKLGEVEKYVDKLDIYNGALTLICDANGNIIGSTNHLYQGGNYTLPEKALIENIVEARRELSELTDENNREKAEKKVESAEAQKEFGRDKNEYLSSLLNHKGDLRYSLGDLSFGYANGNGVYNCFIIAPVSNLILQIVIVWLALAFVFIAISLFLRKMLRKNNQILTDVLTGLNNRRAFLKYSDNHILHHADEELGLLMLDINHFKKINDEFGHIIGDRALLDIAGVLKNACADSLPGYFLCRYGGDEFLIAGKGATSQDLDIMKKKITKALEYKNKSGNNPYILEASMGISNGLCINKAGLENLLIKADKEMYEEKKRMEIHKKEQ